MKHYRLSNINLNELEQFHSAYEALMYNYKIPFYDRDQLLDILQTFHTEFDGLEWIFDFENAKSALIFFHGYVNACKLEQVCYEAEFGESNNGFEPTKANVFLQITSKNLEAAPIALDYYGAADIGVKHLYNLMRTSDPLLLELLNEYPDIPPLGLLEDMIRQIGLKIEVSINAIVLETIHNLLSYLKAHLNKVTSRKKHLLIFELLYLSDILKHIEQANNIRGKDHSLHLKTTDKFCPTVRINDLNKTGFINAYLKNQAK